MIQPDLPLIGEPLDRVDGRLKVTGGARYTADMPVENLAYGVLITSTVASGRIREMDTSAAERLPGVLAILTPFNAPRIPGGSIQEQGANRQPGAGERASGRGGENATADSGHSPERLNARMPESGHQPSTTNHQPSGGQQRRPPDRKVHLLQETDVFYSGQPIGVAIADTFERAVHAASAVRVRYETNRPATSLEQELRRAFVPKAAGPGLPADSRHGDLESGLRQAAVRVEEVYGTPVETHNPMEVHGTIAMWEGDRLTLYDATQGVFPARQRIAALFGVPPDHVRIISYFVGGGFGSKGPVWSHIPLAAMSARHVGRPVKLLLSRPQQFGPVGFRGETRQTVSLGVDHSGGLTALRHEIVAQTSVFDEFIEPAGASARMLYACPNIATSHRGVRLNSGTPSFTRAPGEAPGVFALECAMDELAYRLNMDPIELRLRNYAESDPDSGHPWSSKSLRECYRVGAERFGWSRRAAQPRATMDGDALVGYGMATATYPSRRMPASALARMEPDGRVVVRSGTAEIGTGTYTVMSQVAAEALGVPTEQVRFELGDTELPEAPISAGSMTCASVGSAVYLAAQALRSKLAQLAIGDARSPLHGLSEPEMAAGEGRLFLKSDPSRGERYTDLLSRSGQRRMEARVDARPGEEQQKYSMHAFGAQFAEVHVDPDLGTVRLARYVASFACGRILNAKTARSQFQGGIVWGIGMALSEETITDPRYGRIVNADLAEYHVPVNADVCPIEILFVDEQDPYVNPIGVKGLGEIGIVGVPAAIANAVYHATGKRIRELPITPDKLL